jgi:predicted negative regulator of RcsB-dependent stress response
LDVYDSEKEQVEALRKWWQENGKALIIGVVIGLGGLFGYRGWQDHVTSKAMEAADLHAGVLVALEQAQHATVIAEAARLRGDYAGTPYAALATLAEAAVLVRDDDPGAARTALQWVADNAEQPEVAAVARLRLARLLYDQGEVDAARAALDPDRRAARRPAARCGPARGGTHCLPRGARRRQREPRHRADET